MTTAITNCAKITTASVHQLRELLKTKTPKFNHLCKFATLPNTDIQSRSVLCAIQAMCLYLRIPHSETATLNSLFETSTRIEMQTMFSNGAFNFRLAETQATFNFLQPMKIMSGPNGLFLKPAEIQANETERWFIVFEKFVRTIHMNFYRNLNEYPKITLEYLWDNMPLLFTPSSIQTLNQFLNHSFNTRTKSLKTYLPLPQIS